MSQQSNDWGRYISLAGQTVMVRVPGTKQLNYSMAEIDDAIAMRDQLANERGYPLTGPTRRVGKSRTPNRNKANPELPSGVVYIEKDDAYQASWREGDEDHRVSRFAYFGVATHGSQAKDLAIKKRQDMEKLHYKA